MIFHNRCHIILFQAARTVGWLPDPAKNTYPKTSHVGFGLVLGSDGKRFRTRSSEVVRLVELLDEAKSRSKAELKKRLEDNGMLMVWLFLLAYLFYICEHLIFSFCLSILSSVIFVKNFQFSNSSNLLGYC